MDERIVCVELDHDGHLFAVWTEDDIGGPKLYDFEWSKRCEQHIFQMAGFGGRVYLEHDDHRWWAADGVEVTLARGGPAPADTRLAEMPAAAQGDIFCDGMEDDALWCSECEDWQPASEPCAHCWWDEEACEYSTPDERALDASLSKENPDGE